MATPIKSTPSESFRIPSTPTSVKFNSSSSLKIQKRKMGRQNSPEDEAVHPVAIRNPFTPRDCRKISFMDPSSEDPKLMQHHIARFQKEFFEIGTLGSYHHCFHRLDGCKYTLKRLPAAGSLNEVWAHAALNQHRNIVTYFSAWAEDGHVIIQREFCNRGSLADIIHKNRKKGLKFSQSELKSALFQMINGLAHIHSKWMAHTDMKASNIFVCNHPHDPTGQLTYKIDGFESAAPWTGYGDVDKTDVLDLGRIVWDMAGGNVDAPLSALLAGMMHPEAAARPSSRMLALDPLFDDHAGKSYHELDKELQAERMQNRRLSILLQRLQNKMRRLS